MYLRIQLKPRKLNHISVMVDTSTNTAYFSSPETLHFVELNCSGLPMEFLLLHWKADAAKYREINRAYNV